MRYRKQAGTLICWLLSLGVFAQKEWFVPVNIRDTYKKETRSPDGRPGKNYWQNRANYTLTIDFDPGTRLLSGKDEIQYFNNSPDTLYEIWFKLYPNLYQKGNIRTQKIDPSDITDGVNIESIKINAGDSARGKTVINGTNMTVPINPLPPGQAIVFNISYSYTLNKGSHIRTGEVDSGADFIAYFFPRIAVYDDIDGWNRNPYTGTEEFYNDFCHFFASIKVPDQYIVWATGDLQNGQENLNEPYYSRMAQAVKSDSVTDIIDSADLTRGGITKSKDNTWKFEADQVTDFAFATSNHYVWQASGLTVDPSNGRRTRVDAVFNPKHTSYYQVAGYARKTVQAMSYQFPKWPYPYPHETVFDGLDKMEYPMMVNDDPLEKTADDIELTVHEIFHTLFPFYMGINETKYGWMDEGWATLGEWLISPMIDSMIEDSYGMAAYEYAAGTEEDQPVTTLTTATNGISLFVNSYSKPAMGYLFVKDLLGDALFEKAIHYYMEQWGGKHPMPYDFFNCINTASGRNLDWFWKRWFFDSGQPDLAITGVLHHGKDYAAVIESKGSKPVPVDLTVYFEDGAKLFLHRDISFWEYGNKAISIPFHSDRKPKRLVLGSLHIPDAHKADNSWEIK